VLYLKVKVTSLESALESDCVEVGGQEFQSELSTGEYVTREAANRGPFIFIDVVLLLQLAHQTIVNRTQAVKERAEAKRAGFSMGTDAYISTPYSIVLPTVFGGLSSNQDATINNKRPFPALETYSSWDGRSIVSGRRSQLERNIQTQTSTLTSLIDNTVLLTSLASALAVSMLHESQAFCGHLFAFMSSYSTYETDPK
jgi:hypothetical protein